MGSGGPSAAGLGHPKSYLVEGDRQPAPQGIPQKTDITKQVFLTPRTQEQTFLHQQSCPSLPTRISLQKWANHLSLIRLPGADVPPNHAPS